MYVHIYVYVCIDICKGKDSFLSPHPSHSLPEEPVVSISASRNHIHMSRLIYCSLFSFDIHCKHTHTHTHLHSFVHGGLRKLSRVHLLCTSDAHFVGSMKLEWWGTASWKNFLRFLKLVRGPAAPSSFRHSSCFIIGRLSLLQDSRELSNLMLRLKENKGRLKGWGWDLGTVPKIITPSFSPGQQMQEVSTCGVHPALGHPVGLWETQSSQNQGKGDDFGKHQSWWKWNRSSPAHQPDAGLLCAFTWTENLREAPCSWASALFGSSQYHGKLRASELCSEIFPESQEELGAAVYLLHPLLTEEVCFLSHLQLKEKEQLWCTGSSDMSGSALSGLRSNFVRWNVHVSQMRTPAIRPLGNLLEDREVKQRGRDQAFICWLPMLLPMLFSALGLEVKQTSVTGLATIKFNSHSVFSGHV